MTTTKTILTAALALMAFTFVATAPARADNSTYDRECKASPIRPGFVGYCNSMNKSRDEASERQQRSGLVEGQWYLVAKDSVNTGQPPHRTAELHQHPQGEPVRMLRADDNKPVVAFKIFPNGGAIARDAIGPTAHCTVTETVDRRPYSSTTPIRSLSCAAD